MAMAAFSAISHCHHGLWWQPNTSKLPVSCYMPPPNFTAQYISMFFPKLFYLYMVVMLIPVYFFVTHIFNLQ